ncbi:hypothetical protein [Corallococcus sp. CA053C]|uniref:hypothetical protein n=1 Tax=Corallococcus sp. CA053C TaxID=2316732 RepID=UPI0011C43E27|nr:hypothetical protein [Corallococcus sp. CA053C]
MTRRDHPRDTKITTEDFSKQDTELARLAIAELTKKGVSTECKSCGKNNWNIFAMKIVATSATETFFPAATTMNVPVLSLTCLECGWISMHNLKILGVTK